MKSKFKTQMRTELCGNIDKSYIDKSVTLCGWVNKKRNHGNLIFVDLRDRSGIIQITSNDESIISKLKTLNSEDVIQIQGIVCKRPENMINKKMKTGELEVEIKEFQLLSKSAITPFIIDDNVNASETLRLKYRYLDLRRNSMQHVFKVRSDIYANIRNYLNKQGFIEIETPIMSKSTPEGARDYLVPSRIHKGKFYALVQSPQLYKQILMISGFDRYFQFARCFRDEDLRADRQPEHTQIDIEMSFVHREDIFNIVEGMIKELFEKIINVSIEIPFEIMDYETSMNKYGTDKPDIRFELFIENITDIAKNSNSNILKNNAYTGCIFSDMEFSRKEIDMLNEIIKSAGGYGVGYIKNKDNQKSGPFAKHINLDNVFKNRNGIVFIVSGEKKDALKLLGLLRNSIAKMKGIIDESIFKFVWVVDFPLFEWNDEEEKYEPCHHIFTMPKKEFIGKLKDNPSIVKGDLYDLVCNGVEIASGSIRIHNYDIQREVMDIIGIDEKTLMKKFGFLMEAFKYGAPPHGGIAPGIDRLVMLMLGKNNIRDVIAFPKTLNAVGLMENCPSEVSEEQLNELGIKLDNKNENKN